MSHTNFPLGIEPAPPILETEFLDSRGHCVAFHLTYQDGEVIKFGQPDTTGLTRRVNPPVPAMFVYPDLMIDIEALADTPDSAPAEIGLVFFDRDDASRAFLKYRYQPSPISAIQLGFNVTPGTLKWWHDQGMPIDVEAGEPLPNVLDEIARDIALHGIPGKLRVWSRGNAYDISILKLAYARTGKPLPWNFWNDRDVRTWLEGCRFKSPRKNDHNALQDACNQALDVIEATVAIPENPRQPLQPMQPAQPLA
jgi:hypothetical protein